MIDNKIINWIDEHTSPYDNAMKIGFMLFLTALIMFFTGDFL